MVIELGSAFKTPSLKLSDYWSRARKTWELEIFLIICVLKCRTQYSPNSCTKFLFTWEKMPLGEGCRYGCLDRAVILNSKLPNGKDHLLCMSQRKTWWCWRQMWTNDTRAAESCDKGPFHDPQSLRSYFISLYPFTHFFIRRINHPCLWTFGFKQETLAFLQRPSDPDPRTMKNWSLIISLPW